MVKKYIILESKLSGHLKNLILSGDLETAIKIVSNIDTLKKLVGNKIFTRKVKEDFIKSITKKHGAINVHDLGEEPIIFRDDEDETWEIDSFGISKVSLSVFYKMGYGDRNEIYIHYDNLSDKHINEIFDILTRHPLNSFEN